MIAAIIVLSNPLPRAHRLACLTGRQHKRDQEHRKTFISFVAGTKLSSLITVVQQASLKLVPTKFRRSVHALE